MVSDDIMRLPSSSDSSGNNLQSSTDVENNADESQKACDDIEDGVFTMEDLGEQKEEHRGDHTMAANVEKVLSAEPPRQSVEVVESVSVSHCLEANIVQSENGGNSVVADQREQLVVEDIIAVERPQDECSNKESSVRVRYSSLPSRSKRKLEELLHQWSEWHTQHCVSAEGSVESLESGEETYFPALNVGSDKSSTVSFSMDVHVRKRQRKETLSLDNDCSPLYDRGFAMGLKSDEGVSEGRPQDVREAPRCFNCGSYNHPLNECPKPRDNAAVNSARKQFLTKKSQNAGPRVPTRYYQESPGGKFDGLKPGGLSAETRKLLGLGELDPPPWLNRMRELGYPPGYLESEEEDQPSGIAIIGDDETQNSATKTDPPSDLPKHQKKKMTVDFPGINTPTPENADPNRWAPPSFPPCSISSSPSDNRWSYGRDSFNNRYFHGEHMPPRNHMDAPWSHSRLVLSPPSARPHYPFDYHASPPFSPRDPPIPGSPHHGILPPPRYYPGSF